MHNFLLSVNMFYIERVLQPILMILMALTGIVTVVLVLLQKGTNDNIGAIGGNESDSYAGKNKSKSKDFRLKVGTIVCGALMLLFSVAYFVMYLIW
ncbi:MAG: preprotein translocase subunit SecG [Clostridia bacterium]|nr:preprotein translocase subunit SecG [Clostridia bacterium]